MRFGGFLLSSAAVLSAAAANAANLPTVEPTEYVRICNAFGQGFFYIPGSDTCLRIGGYVRAESHYVDGDVALLFGAPGTSEFNNWTTRSRAQIRFDAQTASDVGLIRTYMAFEMTVGPGDFGPDYTATDSSLPEAFIQVTGDHGMFTVGRAASFFDFYSSDDFGTRVDIDDNTTEQTLFAYTLFGPNGLRGTISVEDPDSSGRRLTGADDHEGQELPDLVGNIRVDKEWGSAQLMGVVRQIHDVDGDGLGWAVGGGASVTLPGAKVGLWTQAGYADGALAYITTDRGGIGDFGGPTGEDTNQAWMVRAGITAPLTQSVSGWLDGSFTHAEDNANDDSYDFWAFVVGAAWARNETLTMGPEFGYNAIDGDDDGEDGDVWGVMWRVESTY